MRLRWVKIAPILLLGACGSSAATEHPSDETSSAASGFGVAEESADTSEIDTAEFDEDRAREDARQEAADEGYGGSCTQDCSGHDAGYAWAADGEEDGGTSSSQSFDEGQEAYASAVEEKLAEKRRQFESEGSGSQYAK